MRGIIFFLILQGGFLQAQTFDWGIGSGTFISDYPNKTIFDSLGNLYTTGHMGSSGGTFGSFTSTESGAFLVKQDSNGNVMWARFMNGQDATGADVVVDSKGNIYVVGFSPHHLTVEDITLIGDGLIFLIKYAPDGSKMWVKKVGSGLLWHDALAIDQFDNVYLAGSYFYDLDLGNDVTLSDGTDWRYTDMFLSKFSSDGIAQWGFSISSIIDDYIIGIEIGEDQNIYFLGQYTTKTVKFQNTIHEFQRDFGSFILRCTLNGVVTKVIEIDADVHDFKVDKSNRLVVAGSPNTIDINHSDFLVTKYDIDFNPTFTRVLETNSVINTVALASIGAEIYLSGAFLNGLSIDDFNSEDAKGNFIVKFSDVGYAQWMKIIPSTALYPNHIVSMATFKKKLALAGWHSDLILDLDGITLENKSGSGEPDIFIALLTDQNVSQCPPKTAQLEINNSKICSGDQADLESNQSQSKILTWMKDNQIYHSGQNNELSVNESGSYRYIINKGTTCADTSNQIFLHVLEYPSEEITEPVNPLCNAPILLTVSPELNHTFQWFKNGEIISGEIGASFLANNGGAYSCIITNDGLCSTISEIVTVIFLPEESNFLPDTLKKCKLKSIELAPLGLKYNEWLMNWTGGETGSSIVINEEGKYSLTLQKNNCQYSDTTVVQNFDALWFPNVITPNGDLLNDLFQVKNLVNPINFIVYNRWGQLVYQNRAYENNWSGENLDAGIYFFHAEDNSGCSVISSSGWVQLIR